MNIKKHLSVMTLIFMVTLSGCFSDDSRSTGSLNFKFTSSSGTIAKTFWDRLFDFMPVTKAYALDLGFNIVITDFQVAVEKVRFYKVGEDPDVVIKEITFNGPFQVDVLDSTSSLVQTIGNAEIETGNYSRVRLVLHKSNEIAITENLYNRSIYVEGTINGNNFVMWHDTNENFDLEEPGGFTIVEGFTSELTLDFKLGSLLNQIGVSTLTNATDVDVDGTIEINPGSDDGHSTLADNLKDSIKAVADLIKQ